MSRRRRRRRPRAREVVERRGQALAQVIADFALGCNLVQNVLVARFEERVQVVLERLHLIDVELVEITFVGGEDDEHFLVR